MLYKHAWLASLTVAYVLPSSRRPFDYGDGGDGLAYVGKDAKRAIVTVKGFNA